MLPMQSIDSIVDEDIGGDPFFEVEKEGHVEKSAKSTAFRLFGFPMLRLPLPGGGLERAEWSLNGEGECRSDGRGGGVEKRWKK